MSYLTIVYRLPDDFDAALLTNHPHASAFAWSHKMDECRKLTMDNEQLKEERNRFGIERQNAVATAVLAEREACAHVCDMICQGHNWETHAFAKAIRARGGNA